jgi:hypothetical protein
MLVLALVKVGRLLLLAVTLSGATSIVETLGVVSRKAITDLKRKVDLWT